jgi:hypothetical protein
MPFMRCPYCIPVMLFCYTDDREAIMAGKAVADVRV